MLLLYIILMDNHPIPQNVTGFQFKLIGDITIKQFVYLVTGVVSGWLFFSLPITPFVKFPIAAFLALAGISFAFIPIAGRPVDVMVANFIKSLFNPTQYIYGKTDQDNLRPNAYVPPTPNPQPSTPYPVDLHQKILSLEEQLRETLSQKQQLTQQIIDLQKKLSLQEKTIPVATTFSPKTPPQNFKTVSKDTAKIATLALMPDSPNIVAGIVTDPRGNPLPNILIEIKDKEGNPVRAFKTSVLGQFMSATQLSNGSYTIRLEDPNARNKFDSIGIEVTGKKIAPIEIKSVDAREELRRSLFNQPTN